MSDLAEIPPPGVVLFEDHEAGPFAEPVRSGAHVLRADEPTANGGNDSGPDPYSYLLAALGTCTAMTLRMYARQKKWPLEKVRVVLKHDKVHATDCATCVKEMPDIVATYNKYQSRGYETVAVAMSYDPPAYVVNFRDTRQLPFKVAIDNTGAVAKAWGDVKLTPTTYLVDKQGRIVKRFVGEPEFDALHQLVDKLLAQG